METNSNNNVNHTTSQKDKASQLFRDHNLSMKEFRRFHDKNSIVDTGKIAAGWLLLPCIQISQMAMQCTN